jgi:NTE family protein
MHSDLERMTRINNTLKLIPREKREGNEGLQHIDSFVLNPSHNFNAIASGYYQELPLSIRLLLRSSGITSDSDSSILSYLLFDKQFCSELIKLGFEDAIKKEKEIRSFLHI